MILAIHVYGNPGDVGGIEKIAREHGRTVILEEQAGEISHVLIKEIRFYGRIRAYGSPGSSLVHNAD